MLARATEASVHSKPDMLRCLLQRVNTSDPEGKEEQKKKKVAWT
jgi:hypothetical protein